MIRVLQMLGTVGLGGAESRVMDLYSHMDRDKIQFDFLVTEGTDDHYKAEIESMGGRVYYLPAFRMVNIAQYRNAVKEFFGAHVNEYAAVHGHMTSTASIYLPIAREYGVPLLIAHARSAGVDPGLKGLATRFLRRGLWKKCDVMLTCSDEAGDSVFGKGRDYKFMPNAIDTAEYAYDPEARARIRSEYGIADDEILIGHVGSFRFAKNHEFVLKVFNDLGSRYKLMLVGDGSLRTEIESHAASLGISDRVIFTGNKSPIAPYYSAFDLLLFPSRYEGMPGTVVEAQASGLPCVISSAITPQVIFTDLVKVLSLEDPVDKWIEAIKRLATDGEADDRNKVLTTGGEPISTTNFDVNKQVEYYTKLYLGNR
ncbi:MAG: glycosyltransferase family 1 protein [Lachnospiraceae bacterium]|nr:glycosyltransferase family 1 protein [Lachnospiraceae bacterium]